MNASSKTLLELWRDNAMPWTSAVRGQMIESRLLATDRAVVDAVMATQPPRVLDVGCGEGWLTRALCERGVDAVGVDAVAALVDQARLAGVGRFEVASFAELMNADCAHGFDSWVCNFSLFHPDDGLALLKAAARHLPAHGSLVVQTLHANATLDGHPGEDGWQPGSWGAMGPNFQKPIPWYFRSQATWRALLSEHGFSRVDWHEPAHPRTGHALAMLFAAQR